MTEPSTACHLVYKASAYADYVPITTHVTSLIKLFLKCVIDLTGYQPTDNEHIFADVTSHSYGRYLLLTFFPVGGAALVAINDYIEADETPSFEMPKNYDIYWEDNLHPLKFEYDRRRQQAESRENRQPFMPLQVNSEHVGFVYATPVHPQVETPVMRGGNEDRAFERPSTEWSPYLGRRIEEARSGDSSVVTTPFDSPEPSLTTSALPSPGEAAFLDDNSSGKRIEMDLAHLDLDLFDNLSLQTPANGKSNSYNRDAKFPSDPGPSRQPRLGSEQTKDEDLWAPTPSRNVVHRTGDGSRGSSPRRKLFDEPDDKISAQTEELPIMDVASSVDHFDLLPQTPPRVVYNPNNDKLASDPGPHRKRQLSSRPIEHPWATPLRIITRKLEELSPIQLEDESGSDNDSSKEFVPVVNSEKASSEVSFTEDLEQEKLEFKQKLEEFKRLIDELKALEKHYFSAQDKLKPDTTPNTKDNLTRQVEAANDIRCTITRAHERFEKDFENALRKYKDDPSIVQLMQEIQMNGPNAQNEKAEVKVKLKELKKAIAHLKSLEEHYSSARDKLKPDTTPNSKYRLTTQMDAAGDISNGLRKIYEIFDDRYKAAATKYKDDPKLVKLIDEIQQLRPETEVH